MPRSAITSKKKMIKFTLKNGFHGFHLDTVRSAARLGRIVLRIALSSWLEDPADTPSISETGALSSALSALCSAPQENRENHESERVRSELRSHDWQPRHRELDSSLTGILFHSFLPLFYLALPSFSLLIAAHRVLERVERFEIVLVEHPRKP